MIKAKIPAANPDANLKSYKETYKSFQWEEVAKELNFSFLPLFCRPPVIDPRLREILRRLLCARYPWLCRRFALDPRLTSRQDIDEAESVNEAMMLDIEDLLDEIMDELARG